MHSELHHHSTSRHQASRHQASQHLYRTTALFCLLGTTISCSTTEVGHGKPETLRPIVGGGASPALADYTTEEGEMLHSFAVDLGPLEPAWPSVAVELPDLIRALIARGSWFAQGRLLYVADGALWIRNSKSTIQQVQLLVEDLNNRLLRPLDMQVAFVEFDNKIRQKLVTTDGKTLAKWNDVAFRSAVNQQQGRTLARTSLHGYVGQWVSRDGVSTHSFVSGVDVTEGAVTPRMTNLASGFTMQAAAWRWDEGRAIIACTGSYTGPAEGGKSVQQTVHRELPRKKNDEHEYQPYQVDVPLPVRDLLEFQGQVTVDKGVWTIAALLPQNQEKLRAVLVKVDWQSSSPPATIIDPLSGQGFVLDIIPIALPTDPRQYGSSREVVFSNRQDIANNDADWFNTRAKSYQQVQKDNVYNFQAQESRVQESYSQSKAQSLFDNSWQTNRSKGTHQVSQAPSGVMPHDIEQLRQEVIGGDWPEGSALEFIANHLFAVNSKAMVDKTRALMEKTQQWRNQRHLLDAAFPVVDSQTADALSSNQIDPKLAQKMRSKKSFFPGGFLQARGGAWTEVFVGEMHTALSLPWSPDRSSPSLHVFWRGARLGIQPQLDALPTQRLSLNWKQHQLSNTDPKTVAGTVLQQPVGSIWELSDQLTLRPEASGLIGLHGSDNDMRALLLRMGDPQ